MAKQCVCSIERALSSRALRRGDQSPLSRAYYSGSFLASAALVVDPLQGVLVHGVATAGDRFAGYTAYEVRFVRYQ
jgi:hypothetical protein